MTDVDSAGQTPRPQRGRILRLFGWALAAALLFWLVYPPAPPDLETRETAAEMVRQLAALEERMELLQQTAWSRGGEVREEFDRVRFDFDVVSAGTRALVWRAENSGTIDWDFIQMVYKGSVNRLEDFVSQAEAIVAESGVRATGAVFEEPSA